ncbi:MAG: phenylalanine--tRNA ligase subunit beta, partial [bacterium]
MKVPYNWLKDYVDIDLSPELLADRLTNTGLAMDAIEYHGGDVSNVVVGQINRVDKHPNADRLTVCTIDVGGETLQVITGATNVKEGDKVPVALHGAVLANEIRIKNSKIRGVESFGMLCSTIELGVGENAAGIMILAPDAPLGVNIKEFLGLGGAILDIDVLPNRPDCLSMIGIAREVSAMLTKPLKIPKINLKESKEKNKVKVTVQDPDLCPRYMARRITGIKIANSPNWMKQRLLASGIRPINNIVDITNYLLLETGQPMHAFDASKIKDESIIVRRVKSGEKMETLDGSKRELPKDALCIAD